MFRGSRNWSWWGYLQWPGLGVHEISSRSRALRMSLAWMPLFQECTSRVSTTDHKTKPQGRTMSWGWSQGQGPRHRKAQTSGVILKQMGSQASRLSDRDGHEAPNVDGCGQEARALRVSITHRGDQLPWFPHRKPHISGNPQAWSNQTS